MIGNLIPPSLKLIHVPCPKSLRNKSAKGSGGGVAMIYKYHLKVHQQKTPSFKTFECMEVMLTTGAGCACIVVIQRPPGQNKSGQPVSVFLQEFYEYIDGLSTTNGELLLLGDFNLPF